MTLCWQPKTHLVLSQNTSQFPSKVSWCSRSGIMLLPVLEDLKVQTRMLDLEVLLEKEEAKTHLPRRKKPKLICLT